jgi:death-on-curing protein
MSEFLSIQDVMFMHADLIDRYGGSHGIRSQELLEAALFRPQSGYYPDLCAEAAALWHSLSQNHPFIDGNKRVAFAATYTFLEINGYFISATADQVWVFLDALYASGGMTYENLYQWLQTNTKAYT